MKCVSAFTTQTDPHIIQDDFVMIQFKFLPHPSSHYPQDKTLVSLESMLVLANSYSVSYPFQAPYLMPQTYKTTFNSMNIPCYF